MGKKDPPQPAEPRDELIVDEVRPGRARIRKSDDDSVKMFEPVADGPLPIDPPAAYVNNASVAFSEHTNLTQAMVVHGYNEISIVQWDPKLEKVKTNRFEVKNTQKNEVPVVLQARFVTPSSRNSPLIAVGSTAGAFIYDSAGNRALLSFNPISAAFPKNQDGRMEGFCRGVTCVENTIFMGTSTGAIMTFNCSGSTTVSIKKVINEHKYAIADMATCKFDELTASADASGTVIVWTKGCKSANKKIAIDPRLDITVINVLRKQVLIGCVHGQVLIYAAMTGAHMASVAAHTRAVVGISVAPESAYVLTASEDSSVRVFKLHTRKPEAYQLEFRYGDELDNNLLTGAHFANDRGSSMVFAAFDVPNLLLYKIYKKPAV